MTATPLQVLSIPVVTPPEDFSATSDMAEIVDAAFQDIGFVFVQVPWITWVSEKQGRIYKAFQELFDLPTDTKMKYARPEIGYQRGYLPLYQEIGLACRRLGPHADMAVGDCKEAWFMAQDLGPDHPYYHDFPVSYQPNVWPQEPEAAAFRGALTELYQQLWPVGDYILRLLALSLGKSEMHFSSRLDQSPTVLRAINYPATNRLEIAPPDGQVIWGCAHTDINYITVLPAATRSALRVQRRDGEWVPGHAPPGCVLAQVGDMLQYETNHRYMSAVHEVVAPEGGTDDNRLSAAMFFHPRSDTVLTPEPQWQARGVATPILGRKPKSEYRYLIERLVEINLAPQSVLDALGDSV